MTRSDLTKLASPTAFVVLALVCTTALILKLIDATPLYNAFAAIAGTLEAPPSIAHRTAVAGAAIAAGTLCLLAMTCIASVRGRRYRNIARMLCSVFFLGAAGFHVTLWRLGYEGSCGCFGASAASQGDSAAMAILTLGASIVCFFTIPPERNVGLATTSPKPERSLA